MSDNLGPLTRLRLQLRCEPRSLSILLQWLSNADDYKDFIAVVGEFLPEHVDEILRQPDPSDQMRMFCELFSPRYFPLDEIYFDAMDDFSFNDFLRYMPIQIGGIGCDDYEEIPNNCELPTQLLTYLLEDPYIIGGGARVALGDSLMKADIPLRLLERVPEKGLSHEDAERIFKGTEHEGVLVWSQILNQCTNTYYYDNDRETIDGSNMPGWSRGEIDNITYDWYWASMLMESLTNMEKWLDKNPVAHFEELLEFIDGDERLQPLPGQPRLLVDVFEEGGEDGEEEGRPQVSLTTIP